MKRLGIGFIAGLTLGLWGTPRAMEGAGGATDQPTQCQISVHLMSDPPGFFRC